MTTESSVASSSGRELYLQHCAACHGETGDAKGVAAAFLFPKPRDFRAGRFRLVSTSNSVPTASDLEAVLVRGMPGSSMPPWAHLSGEDRKLLADEVMRLRAEGAREIYVQSLKEEEGLTTEEIAEADVQEEIDDFVNRFTTPGDTSEVPEFSEPDADTIARGKELYVVQGCHACHGAEGKGDGVQVQFDDEGYPTTPRDYTSGIFKGGHDPASLYRRIAFGMPGTPMPASTNLTSEQNTLLVHFIRSMSDETAREAALLKRQQLVVIRVEQVPDTAQAGEWSSVEGVGLRMTPLWWRNDADPDLEVQAVHDGRTIAIRLSWRDATPDQHAARSESFEDAVAVELYRGQAEPFIGMGDPKSPVDVWFWDADRQTRQVVEDIYPNTVVDIYPLSETKVDTTSFDRPGTKTSSQPEVSLPALASGNPIVPIGAKSGGSSLTVGGPATVTFRLPKSPLVEARGEWNNGRWTVLMTRPLAVESATDGIALEPGAQVSIAFAVWDGTHRERDGKKLITIWHDLKLEKTP